MEDSTTGEIRAEAQYRYLSIAFIYFLIQSLPINSDLLPGIKNIDWPNISYGDLFTLSRLTPQFIPGKESFLNWVLIAILAIVGALIWEKFKFKQKHFDRLYYWLRVIVRYRLAIGILGYGFLKLFPMQAPYPSLSNLHTHYGDLTDWKMFSMSLGIVPAYESFLGAVEILAGLLLLFRKTATLGALVVLIFTGNVFISNLAYDGGEYVYSFYLISFALFVLSFDAERIFTLISLNKPVRPNRYKRHWNGNLKTARLVFKGLIIFVFVFIYGIKAYSGFKNAPYQFPNKPGLTDVSGIYSVSTFRINGKVLPYSQTDSVRWKDVVFEKWATLSIRSNRPIVIDDTNFEKIQKQDFDRNYELAGIASRHYYSYEANPADQTIVLKNKNRNYPGETLKFKISRPDSTTVILSGTDQKYDSLYVVLEKMQKRYPLYMGRRNPLTL